MPQLIIDIFRVRHRPLDFLAEKLPGVGVGKRLDHVAMEAIILLMGR